MALVLLVAAGCSGSASPGTASAPPTPGAGYPSASVIPASTPAEPRDPWPSVSISLPVPPGPDQPAPGGYTARQVHRRGSEGTVSWDIAIPEVAGGPATAQVNRRVVAAAEDAIDRVRRQGPDDEGTPRRLTGEGVLVTNDGRTVQVTTTFVDYLQGTVHPSNDVATTVVTADRGAPVRLAQVLGNERQALGILGRRVTEIARKQGEPVTDRGGLAPREANWANWQSTSRGLVFVFGDYQLGGYGLRSYTVPWSAARPLLSAEGSRLLDPDRQ